ncbi:MAG: hypothetical protein KBD73_00830 [Candidatus Magasanikbacteria bacterium]|nr:hypothetical protein [Candidatus Magasanikbacteria bacterium]
MSDENDLAALESFLGVLTVNRSAIEFRGFTRVNDEITRELLPANPDAILVEAGLMARKIEYFFYRQAECFKSCPIIIVYTDTSSSDFIADIAFGQISMSDVRSPSTDIAQSIFQLLERAVNIPRNLA